MEISHTKLWLTMLIGMRGCITPNVRAVSVDYGPEHIHLFFYYETQFTEDEEELAEEVATQVVSAFPEIVLHSFKVNKTIYPYPNKIPNEGFIVYARYEPTPKHLID